MSKSCSICSRPITEQFWVCCSCEQSHNLVGQSYREWPEWVKEMVRTSRRETKASRREIPESRLNMNDGDIFEFYTNNNQRIVSR